MKEITNDLEYKKIITMYVDKIQKELTEMIKNNNEVKWLESENGNTIIEMTYKGYVYRAEITEEDYQYIPLRCDADIIEYCVDKIYMRLFYGIKNEIDSMFCSNEDLI